MKTRLQVRTDGAAPLIDSTVRLLYIAGEQSRMGMRDIGSTFQEFLIGETVAYSETFLDCNRQYANNMPGARGKVTALHYLDKVTLADVEWDKPGLPKRVNIKYLVVA
jgi:hypothetical protein